MIHPLSSSGLDQRRLVLLEGGTNFRDLGGYVAADGRSVRWGRLFRSGNMSRLTAADHQALAKLSIRTVCDLRTSYERQAEPNTWCEIAKVTYWAHDYEGSLGELGALMSSGSPTAEAARNAMRGIYQQLPFEQAPAYRELFLRLAAEETPLIFNCAVGKDRTGIAAALVLLSLQVPRSTVVEDYLLTNTVLNPPGAREQGTPKHDSLARVSAEVINALMAADADYLATALEAIESRCGSVAGYLRDELGLADETLRLVRSHLLE